MAILGVKNMMDGKNKPKNQAQLIALMGIILAISVFLISSLAAEIANIDFVVSTGESTSLSNEFKNVRENFGIALNYNLIDIKIGDGTWGMIENESYFEGDLGEMPAAFEQTKYEYFSLLFRHGIVFDAYLNHYWYSHEEVIQGGKTVFYNVDVTLSLDDGDSSITEDVIYLIACTPEMS